MCFEVEILGKMTLCQRSYPALNYSMHSVDLVEQFDILRGHLASTKEKRVALRHGLWDSMHDEILWTILMRLPVATQFRLRAVCKRWKRLLCEPSPAVQCLRPTGTILSDAKLHEDWFFCHEENRWFRFPFQSKGKGVDNEWDLAATDGGLLCYEWFEDSRVFLLVCNPITGTHIVLSLKYPGSIQWTRLYVDRESKTFTVVLFGTKATLTFDSKRGIWKVFASWRKAFPDLPKSYDENPDLVWNNVIYKRVEKSRHYITFDLNSGEWSKEYFDLPCDMDKFYHLRSWKDQVVLVQLYPSTKDPVGIWMLRSNETNGLSFSCLDWEKVPITIPKSMKVLVSELHYCLSYGRDYVCFTTGWTHHWVKYTFKTRRWQVMHPISRHYNYGRYKVFEWFNFEPQRDMDPTLRNCKDGGSDSSDDFVEDSDDSEESDDSSDPGDANEVDELDELGAYMLDELDELGYSGDSDQFDVLGEVDDSGDSDESDDSGDPKDSAELDGSDDSGASDKSDEFAQPDCRDN